MQTVELFKRLLKRFRPIQTLASKEAYALWSASYPPHAHNPFMQIEQAAMLRLMPPLVGRAVLDLACGTGRYGLIAQHAGTQMVVGVDNSLPMLRAGVLRPVAVSSMVNLPFVDQSFDVVICGLATGHLPPDQMHTTIAEIGRVLHPGGEALISDFHPYLSLRAGGKRTFRASDGRTYAVEHYPHLPSDYFVAIRAAGLTLTALDEPRSKTDGSTGGVPAVLVLRCQRSDGTAKQHHA
jgi:malonyl-CoA O-methyltransferase